MLRIAVDAMGGDHAPAVVVEGALAAARHLDVRVLLVGPETRVTSILRPLAGGARVDSVEDVVSVGQKIQVEINEVDDRGKLSLIPVVEESVPA